MTYLPYLHTEEDTRNFIATLFGSKEIWVAECKGEVVGFAVIDAGWLEHLYGTRYWAELSRKDFGILRDMPVDLQPLLDEIVGRLLCGGENLTLTTWYVRERNVAERRQILDLLTRIDVNSCRLRCHFAEQYS